MVETPRNMAVLTPHAAALLAGQSYSDLPTIGDPDSASRMHVYATDAGPVHVFRGTDDVMAAIADADCRTIKVWCLGELHAGFWGALAAILPACLALPRPTAIVGHSLGAAMAIIYAGVLAQQGIIVPVFALEPPRLCGDATLLGLLESRRVPWFACRNGLDLVTQVPPLLSLPGPLTAIGKASAPIPNIVDHEIARVVEALTASQQSAPA